MKRGGRRSTPRRTLGMAAVIAPGLLAGGADAAPRSHTPGLAVILARAEQAEGRITSGRVVLIRTTENNSMLDQELREQIKDPRKLRMELDIARHMPRQVGEAIPTSIVIGKDGAVRYIHAGFEGDDLRQAIESALKE